VSTLSDALRRAEEDRSRAVHEISMLRMMDAFGLCENGTVLRIVKQNRGRPMAPIYAVRDGGTWAVTGSSTSAQDSDAWLATVVLDEFAKEVYCVTTTGPDVLLYSRDEKGER
jgi:predicted NUDIX family NTP pyrophosphohydrolase